MTDGSNASTRSKRLPHPVRKFLSDHSGKWQGLMLDFASLPQKDARGDRTEEETAIFRAGLNSMSAVYASPRVAVIQHKRLPSARRFGSARPV
jgi:hypothetical protein